MIREKERERRGGGGGRSTKLGSTKKNILIQKRFNTVYVGDASAVFKKKKFCIVPWSSESRSLSSD